MMNKYKDTTRKPNTLQNANKPPIARFINALSNCLFIAGVMLFLLLVITSYHPA